MMIRMMPAAVRRVNASERARTPMTTAVRGSRAPRMALRVGPMRLMAATRVMLETAVPSRAMPRILAQRKPSERGTQRTPPESIPMRVKVGAIGNDGECGPENTGGDIAVLEPDVASCQKAGSDQGEYDGTDLDPGAGFVEDRHHDGGHEERVHEVNRRGDSAGDVLVGYQQADGSQGTEEADGQQRKPGSLRDAEGLAHEQAHGQQHEGSHTPAVGEHLERREARIHEGD